MAPSEPSLVLHSTSPEGITIITLNRPHVRNAVNSATASLLAAAFRAFDADATQKVCILTGAGGAFCAGYDLHEVASQTTTENKPTGTEPSHALFKLRLCAPRPLQTRPPARWAPRACFSPNPSSPPSAGPAVAGGLELSLLADMRVADTTAIFGVFCRRWGVPLIDGGTVRLPAVVGLGRAMDMILTGRPVDAREALAMGLVNRVVDEGLALEEALRIARGLVRFPQLCMRADRALGVLCRLWGGRPGGCTEV
ncbi:putative enoylhydratase isomerase family protein [Mycena venus]|uniref:Putative enoylhydratase isomerase family protein n=1 Tax=Mycena venus TaxID=2733690 RepID=A0A8H7CGH5_9AGAR|nr:putative enoylhydratase isomerase family protein [Mycena venus]